MTTSQPIAAVRPFTVNARVRVRATGQLGNVQYVRMAPPEYREVFAVSVMLLAFMVSVPSYRGSMFKPEDLEVL